jgi:hypothetical protein
MRTVKFPGVTRYIGAPADWDDLKQGAFCDNLPVKDEGGFMISCWQPSDQERKLLAEGASIVLHVAGRVHPVVAVGVSQIPFHPPEAGKE